jgi:hypothetical protein
MLRGARSKTCLLLLSGVAGVLAVDASVLQSDRMLSKGFDKALALSREGLSFDAVANRKPTAATAGDEGFWLTRAEVQSPTPFAKPLAVGDRITIAGSDGRERRLEVVNLKAVGGGRAAAAHGRLLLVSCRVTGKAAETAEATVRFLIEADAPESAAVPAKAL